MPSPLTPAKTDATPLPPTVGRVVVVGLGMMGGSFLHALKRTGAATHVTGIDYPQIAAGALVDRLVDEARTMDDADHHIAAADIVVLCLPILGILRFLDDKRAALRQGQVITDVGSTKGEIAERARRLGLTTFVGGHPMAGKPQSGIAHADGDLFENAPWFLCTDEATDPAALRTCKHLVGLLGARPIPIDAQEHDRAVAMTSQLPHLFANLLAELVLDHGALEASGGSLRQVMQVAGANHAIWQDTLSTNRTRAAEGLRDLARRANALAETLEKPELDHSRLSDLFSRGKACREHLATPSPSASSSDDAST